MTLPVMAAVCAVAGAVVAGPAWAQQQATLPLRDVTLTYRLEGAAHNAIPGGAPGNLRVAWSAAGQRLRVEAEGRPEMLLVDLTAPRVELVESGLRSVITLPVKARDLDPVVLREAHLTRRGAATVAGLACTDYAVEARRGHGTVCLTADGVALRGQGTVDGREGGFTALSVAYGPVPASAFAPPPGFMHLALPPGLGRLQ